MWRRIWLAAAVIVVSAVVITGYPAFAGPLEDGIAAAGRGDYGAALRLWKPIAEAGDAIAQNNLGALYARGLGTKKDLVEADKWYLAAAIQGLADAENNIGYSYELGLGLPMDFAAAAMWYRSAAEQGHALGELNLGLFYANGMAVPKDAVTAFMWIGLASAQGLLPARAALTSLVTSMTPAEVAEGQARQIAWRKDHPQKSTVAPP
jgi:TPR repeat protein